MSLKSDIKNKQIKEWLAALEQAVVRECPLGSREYQLHLMSDNGSQPTGGRYEKAVVVLGIEHATTAYSNPKGNADTERWMRTFKEEVVWPTEFSSWEETLAAVTAFITYYNNEYPHSRLGYRSPLQFEQLDAQKVAA